MTTARPSPVTAAGPPSAHAARFTVLQDGSRLHYAIPVALQQAGLLDRVYTDWYGPPGTWQHAVARLMAAVAGAAGRRMLERWSPDLDAAHVRTNPLLAVRRHSPRARRRFATDREFHDFFSEQTARWVLRQGFGDSTAVFGFIRNVHPTVLEAARRQGLLTVADQMIAPAATEGREARLQHERFPDWGSPPPDDRELARLDALEARSRAATDRITCASDYVRDALVADAGVDPATITVIPYPIDATRYRAPDRRGRPGPLRVGFVGTVGLRKGTPYFLEVASALRATGISFTMVGPLKCTPPAGACPENAMLSGPVPRSQIAGLLESFDVFFFPSTCEGSAGGVAEAMAAGLPIIVSPNAGAAVTDGVEGFVVRYDDTAAAADRIAALNADPDRRHQMGLAARRRVEQMSIDHFAVRFAAIMADLARTSGGLPDVATTGAPALPDSSHPVHAVPSLQRTRV